MLLHMRLLIQPVCVCVCVCVCVSTGVKQGPKTRGNRPRYVVTYDCKMEEVEILPNNVSIFHRPKQLNLLEAQAFFGLCTVKKRSSAGEKRYYKRLMSSEANEENDDELVQQVWGHHLLQRHAPTPTQAVVE